MTHAIINAKTLLQKYDIIKILKTRKTIIFLFLCLIISMIAGSVSVSFARTVLASLKENFMQFAAKKVTATEETKIPGRRIRM